MISAVIQTGVCRRLVELLQHTNSLVQTPALRALGNIATGDDQQTQVIIHSGALPKLLHLMSHSKKAIRKESCWTISNITAGNSEQIQLVINADLIPPVVHLLEVADFDIKKEAAWVISNATSGGSPQQIGYIIECGAIKPMLDLLAVSDVKIIEVALGTLEKMLKVGKSKQQEQGTDENVVAILVEQAGGLQRIEQLQEDVNEEVYKKAMKILENFFALEEDGGIADAAKGLQFGAALPQGGFNFEGMDC